MTRRVRVLVTQELLCQIFQFPEDVSITGACYNPVLNMCEFVLQGDGFPEVAAGQVPPLVGAEYAMVPGGLRGRFVRFNGVPRWEPSQVEL